MMRASDSSKLQSWQWSYKGIRGTVSREKYVHYFSRTARRDACQILVRTALPRDIRDACQILVRTAVPRDIRDACQILDQTAVPRDIGMNRWRIVYGFKGTVSH